MIRVVWRVLDVPVFVLLYREEVILEVYDSVVVSTVLEVAE
jgi:hypothetical protein